MATVNPFDLLGYDDSEDLSQLLAAQKQKSASKKPDAPAATVAVTQPPAKLPSKPLPPTQAVREARDARNNTGAARGGSGRGRGRRGGGISYNRENANDNARGASLGYEGVSGPVGVEHGERERQPRQPYIGGRQGGYGGRGGYSNWEAGGDSERPPRRMYERRSGTGHGNEMKRDGSGRGNWGTATDDTTAQFEKEEIVNADVKAIVTEKQEMDQVPSSELNKDGAVNEEEKEEDKEMTLEEYEKVREEKRKALLAMKSEERKVEFDDEFQSMKQLSVKKDNNEIFIKLGTAGKDTGKKKENVDRDERSKKPMSFTEFFKPIDGERYYTPRGRGRGRGRGGRGEQFGGGFDHGTSSFTTSAPSIEDPGQFPTLGGK
ncbi:RGG repeats nuclear RNA binding protein A-like [Curcuma longa]|uniref:RGG repeats nuclear RNA binding protein A-like n=1 Tax=Curcuma longa TaxID=136217 RepID=UPI003D9EE660